MGRKKRYKKSTIPELDLHGVRHKDVETTVEDFVLLRKPPIKIITGNSKTMKEIVEKTLHKHGYKTSDFFPACIMVES
jgi:hypothetical protein